MPGNDFIALQALTEAFASLLWASMLLSVLGGFLGTLMYLIVRDAAWAIERGTRGLAWRKLRAARSLPVLEFPELRP